MSDWDGAVNTPDEGVARDIDIILDFLTIIVIVTTIRHFVNFDFAVRSFIFE